MMTVKTIAKPSPIEGIGLFAAERIPQGTVVWEFTPGIDLSFSPEEVEKLPEPKRSEVLSLRYAYISKQTGRYIDCGDDGKYTNHSDTPNIASRPGAGEEVYIAVRDIEAGEEITQDYRDFAEVFTGFSSSFTRSV